MRRSGELLMKLLKTIKDSPIRKDSRVREASRAVIFDENGLVPILFVSKYNYHKLPGGGIERGEDKINALLREIHEETGCTMQLPQEIGRIVEFRSEYDLLQTSYCYLGKVVMKGSPHLEEGEISDGFGLVWLTIDEAIRVFTDDKPTNYDGRFIRERDLTFLKAAKILMKNADS
jgi:8-oxo-dGTP diphosphatase